jgi:hypothetical protein
MAHKFIMHYMHIKLSSSAHTTSNKSNNIYNIQESFNKRYLTRRRRRPWTTMKDYFLQVLTSLELWPSSDVGATTVAFLRASFSTFFYASSFLRSSSFFLLALI